MREIKFRAYADGVMRYDITGLEHGEEYEMGGVFIDGDYYTLNEKSKHIHKFAILMQYTGLKDKNEKEIYEGDIVQWFLNEHVRTGIVNYISDAAGYDLKNFKNKWHIGVDFYRGEFEIIGNIHENPELMKDSKDEG